MKPVRFVLSAMTLGLASLCFGSVAAAANLPVRYTLEAKPLYALLAGTQLQLALYSDPACTSQIFGVSVSIEDVTLTRLARITPRGGAKLPRTAELGHTLTGAPSEGPYYLAVSGQGVVPVPAGAVCQAQSGVGGAAGPFKRGTFEHVTVQPAGQPPVVLTSLVFIPPVSGTAVLRARGYCNLAPTASNNQIAIAIGASPATAFNPVVDSGVGLAIVPSAAGSGLYQPNWTAERTFPVTAGQITSFYLMARHESGAIVNDCSGSFTVEIAPTLMP